MSRIVTSDAFVLEVSLEYFEVFWVAHEVSIDMDHHGGD